MILLALAGAGAGAIAGSFLATVILRWPRGESVARGRSRCDRCGGTLGASDLVPLISFVLRRGRCRRCNARIDRLHPATEAGCALIGAAALWLSPDPAGIGWAVFGWLLLTLAVLDWRHLWLPDRLTMPLIALGCVAAVLDRGITPPDRLIGMGVGLTSLAAIASIYRWGRGREGLGYGDAKLLAGIGGWLGWRPLPLIVLLASVAGLVLVLGWRLAGRPVDRTTALPFGTLLCGAALPGWLAARWLQIV